MGRTGVGEKVTDLPGGTVTLLLTDIEGSTREWEGDPASMRSAVERHDELLQDCIKEHSGSVLTSHGEGDSFFAVFHRASDAAAAAVAIQTTLAKEDWPQGIQITARIAVHTGEADGDFRGRTANRCGRLRSLAHGGQVLISETTAGLVRDDLPKGVGLLDLGRYRIRDVEQPQRIFQLIVDGLPPVFPALRGQAHRPNNLPVQFTSFIGRERETDRVGELLAGAHLVTLTGSGGCGKTRLALNVAATVQDRFADGVSFVELASVREPEFVPQALSVVLGLRERAGQTVTQSIIDHLADRCVLLVLDNCEHILDACMSLAVSLLRACPELRILATSVEPLSVDGEAVLRVPSLSLPQDKQEMKHADLVQYEAPRLFIDRATLADSNFEPTAEDVDAVARICRRLDCIPLAIELAAANVKLLSCHEIAKRLDDRFQLITRGSRAAPARHQTLMATVEWSYQLLNDAERALLHRLSIFVGGFTVDAAEEVCGADDSPVLETLGRLFDKSLIVRDATDDRYRMLETVRQFAVAKLTDSGEGPDVAGRHLTWFVALAERGEEEIRADPIRRVRVLKREQDNVRAAVEWSLTEGLIGQGMRLCGALAMHWGRRGYASEGRGWFQRLLSASGDVAPATRAFALSRAAHLARGQNDFEVARIGYSDALEIYEGIGNMREVSHCLNGLAMTDLGRDDLPAARAFCQRSLHIAQEFGFSLQIVVALNTLGEIARAQGDPAARGLYDQALASAQAAKFTPLTMIVLTNLAQLDCADNDFITAEARLRETITIAVELNDRYVLATVFDGLSLVASAAGRFEQTARLLGASEEVSRAIGVPRGSTDEVTSSRAATLAREGLGDAEFARLHAEGAALSLEDAIDEALK